MGAKTIFGEVFEGSSAVLMARIVGVTGEPLTQADITSIKYEVWSIPVPREYDLRDANSKYVKPDAAEQVVAEVTLDVADVIFDDLQTDERWTKDTDGYNFAVELPADSYDAISVDDYPKALWHEVAVRFVPEEGEPFVVPFKLAVKSILFGKSA